MTGEVPPTTPLPQGQPEEPLQQGQQGAGQPPPMDRSGLDALLQHFMLQPEPKTEDETAQVANNMVELAKAARDEANLNFGLHLQTSAAAQGLVEQEVQGEMQRRTAVAETARSMLSSDFRAPDTKSLLTEQVAKLSELGVEPGQVSFFEKSLRENLALTEALDQDTGELASGLADWKGQGGITRAAQEFGGGLGGELTFGAAGGGTREERITEDLQGILEGIKQKRLGNTETIPPEFGETMTSTAMYGERPPVTTEAEQLSPDVDREVYTEALEGRMQKMLRGVATEEGLSEEWYDRVFRKAGQVAGMAAPFMGAIKAGQWTVRGLRGVAELGGLLKTAGVKLGDDALETIWKLGVAKGPLGKTLERVGGAGLGIFGLEAGKPLDKAAEAEVAALPAGVQDEARSARRIERGLQGVAMAPFFLLGGGLGRSMGLGTGLTSKSVGSATAFGLGGEGVEAATYGAKRLLEDISPEMARKLEQKIIADPELQGPLVGMMESGGPGDPAFGKNLQTFMENWLGDFAGFGILHGVHAMGGPTAAERGMLKEAEFSVRRAIAENESWTPETKKQLESLVSKAAAGGSRSYAEREATQLKGEMERTFADPKKAVEERFDVERVKEGQATTKPERLQEIQELRREADVALEGGDVAREPEARRLQAAEEFLRAEDPAQAEAWHQLYESGKGEMPPAPSETLGAARSVAFERESPRIARRMLQEEAAKPLPEPKAPEWVDQPAWKNLPQESKQTLSRLRQELQTEPVPLDRTRRAIYEQRVLRELEDSVGAEQAPGLTKRWLKDTDAGLEKPPEPAPDVSSELVQPQEPVFGALAEVQARGTKAVAENIQTLEKLDQPTRDAAMEVAQRKDMQGASSEAMAGETVWLREHRKAGQEPAEPVARVTERLGQEFDAVRATENPATLLAWEKLIEPDMAGPLGVVAKSYGPLKEVMDSARNYGQAQFGRHTNSGQEGHLLFPLNPRLGTLRDIWWNPVRLVKWAAGTRGDFLQRADTFAKQSMKDLMSPDFLSEAEAFKGAIKQAALGSPYQLAAHLVSRAPGLGLAHPIGFAGEFGHAMTRLFSGVERNQRDLLKSVNEIVKPLPESPKDSPRDMKEPRHLVTELMRNPEHPGWKEDIHSRIEEIRDIANKVREILDPFSVVVAKSSPYWTRLTQRLTRTEKIIELDESRAAELKPQIEELDIQQRQQFPEFFEEMDVSSKRAGGMRTKRDKAAKREMDELKSELKTAREQAKSKDANLRDFAKDDLARIESRIKELKEPSAEEKQLRARRAELGRKLRKKAQVAEIDVVPMKAEASNRRGSATRMKKQKVRIEADMESYLDIWRDKVSSRSYVHDIMRSDAAQPFFPGPTAWWKRFGFQDQLVKRVQANLAKQKTGKLHERGAEDPDVGRWMMDYVRQVVPYAEHNRFLREWSPKLEGEWGFLDPKTMGKGIDVLRRNSEHYNAEVVYRGNPYQAVLGDFWKAKDGTFHRAKPEEGGEYTTLLWRGRTAGEEGGEQTFSRPGSKALADSKYLGGESARSNLVETPQYSAREQIMVRTGGFFREAGRTAKGRLKDYINDTMAQAQSLDRFMSLNPWVRGAERVASAVGQFQSTMKLGLDPGVAIRGFYGAWMMNSWIMGPVRASQSLRWAPQYAQRLAKAKLKGEPSMDMAEVRVLEPGEIDVMSFRTKAAERLRDGKDPVMDDAYVALYESGVLSGTRGLSWYETHPEFRSDHPLRTATRIAQEIPWAGWTLFEPIVRTGVYMESYLAARKDGRTDKQARDLSFALTNQAHGVFNPAMRSKFFRSGFGRALGPAEGWWRMFSGVYARMDRSQKSTIMGYGAALGALGNSIGYPLASLFTSNLHDVPGGTDAEVKLYEAFPYLRTVYGTGIPAFPGRSEVSTMTTDALGDLVKAMQAGMRGDSEESSSRLWRAAHRFGNPTVVESVRKYLLADADEQTGEYMYAPRWGKADKRIVPGHGWGDWMMDSVMPSEPFYQQSQYVNRTLERAKDERARNQRTSARADLERVFDQMGKQETQQAATLIKRMGKEAPAQLMIKAMGKKNPRLAEVMKTWDENELGPITREAFLDRANMALANFEGIKPIFKAIKGAPDKVRKIELLANWLEEDQRFKRIKKFQWERMKQLVGGAKGWAMWTHDPKIMRTDNEKLERLRAAAKARGFSQ